MRGFRILLVAFAAAAAMRVGAAATEIRVALVIGNGAYANEPHLPNPPHDAEDVAAALKRSNFDVISGMDLDQAGMQEAAIRFARAARTADVAVFYYSGHAMQFSGVNYLIPVDARLEDEADLKRMMRVDDILNDLQQAKNLKILVLDACRNNPLAEGLRRAIGLSRAASIQRGLSSMEAPQGTIISFSTQAGQEAADGEGRNSPYTAAFLRHIEEPNEIGNVFREISSDVYKASNRKQLPELSMSIIGSYYLTGPLSSSPAQPIEGSTSARPGASELEITFWNSISGERNPELFEAYLRRYPNGAFADIAVVRLKELRPAAAVSPSVESPDDTVEITDLALLNEMRGKLYELNFDPAPIGGPTANADRDAIRGFERKTNRPLTGAPTRDLLRRLREIASLKPWGAIAYGQGAAKWGMSWGADTRKAAVESARRSCGAAVPCRAEISFFGAECAAFAHSESSWAIVARGEIGKAKSDAVSECQKRGKPCRIVAAVCANGAERYPAGSGVGSAN